MKIRVDITHELISMLDANNELVKVFRMARDKYISGEVLNLQIRLHYRRDVTARQYNSPTVKEIAALIVGDLNKAARDLDIIVEMKSGTLQQLSYLHPSFIALQYPLLFLYGEDGFHPKIPYVQNRGRICTKRSYVTMREYYANVLQYRHSEGLTLIYSGRLFQ
jgi:hypothetical protein